MADPVPASPVTQARPRIIRLVRRRRGRDIPGPWSCTECLGKWDDEQDAEQHECPGSVWRKL